jgi:phosphoenolpyruvate carboxykinase (ATP)
MKELGVKSEKYGLEKHGLKNLHRVFWNLAAPDVIEHSIRNREGFLTENGSLMVDTGRFTGRSPEDRFVVHDETTKDTIWWGNINKPFEPGGFDHLYNKMIKYLEGRNIYVRDCYAGVPEKYRLKIRVINTWAWHNLFCYNLFIRPDREELPNFEPEFTILNIPDYWVDPKEDNTNSPNFAIINLTRKIIIIGGTGYAGEMKKGIFSIMNYLLPLKHNVLSMHCSANIGEKKDTAIFFGLSGTGKTTLSADPNRGLIGDDEHGWDEKSVFNFEGGCYAKAINLSKETEPDIFNAIKFGTIVENTRFFPGTREVNYEDVSVTENTRVAYPIHYISNAVVPSVGGIPNNIFFLTCDAFGVLPPISKLTKGQAMYHFISGYTAKVAGTEEGITEPKMAFSACFGSPFLTLHPTRYAELLGQKMDEHKANVWLINTGWSGGEYGVGKRMKLPLTRATITAAIEGHLDKVHFHEDPIFGIMIPDTCPGVPPEVLIPINTWKDKEAYNKKAHFLAKAFVKNFEKYADYANEEIMNGAPRVNVEV